MGFIVLLVVLALLVFWLIGAYNKLISLKNQVANAWKQIDVQLKRRHDLIPNLVNTVKGAMQFERETLEAVVAARNQAIKVQQAPGAHVGQTAAAEAQLTGALESPARRRRGLPGSQGDRQRRAAPGGADVDREQDRVLAPAL